MRAPLIALLCGLAAVAALLGVRGCRDHRPQVLAPAASAPASAAVPAVVAPPSVPAAQSSGAASAASPVAAAAAKPAPAASPARSTFALTSDHQALIQRSALATPDHELLEHEPRDDAWATEAERLIREELARSASAGDFEVVAVDCRQTLCAVQAFSYGEKGDRAWVAAMDELYKETLASAFDSVSTASQPQGNRSPVLSFLHRKPAVQR